jgi:predicted dehydrogenase
MKILLIGLGSIGRRHLDCLNAADQSLDLAALRTKKGTLTEQSTIKEFYDRQAALNFAPDGVIIANPTALHVAAALPFLKSGSSVLIEKPVTVDSNGAIELAAYQERIRVAYCMRFHPLSHFLAGLFRREEPYKISFKRSYYLPKWHPYADYRSEYTARKELGGGVIRTLSHEIDLAVHWLGTPVSVVGICDKISPLEIDTDDFAFFSLKMKNGCRVNFELDFLSPTNINIGEAYTARGKYTWDTSEVNFIPYEGNAQTQVVYSSEGERFSQMYAEQIEDFIRFVKTGNSSASTLSESFEVLKIIEAIDGK